MHRTSLFIILLTALSVACSSNGQQIIVDASITAKGIANSNLVDISFQTEEVLEGEQNPGAFQVRIGDPSLYEELNLGERWKVILQKKGKADESTNQSIVEIGGKEWVFIEMEDLKSVAFDLEVAMQNPTLVKELYLENKGLKTVPKEIKGFPNLEVLILKDNYIENVPSFLFEQKSIKHLNLAGNGISEFPVGLEKMVQLESISLSNNALTSIPDSFWELKNLKHLNIEYNYLKEIGEGIAQMEQLNSIRASFNKFTKLPESITNLTNLSYLDISNNGMQYIPSFSRLENLRYLNIGDNGLKALPEGIEKLTKLENLNFNNFIFDTNKPYNELKAVSSEICQLQSLKKLNLQNTSVQSLPDCFVNLKNLEQLVLDKNFPKEQMDFLKKQMPNLKHVSQY